VTSDSGGIDRNDSGAECRHSSEVSEIETQHVSHRMHMTHGDEPRIMDLLSDDSQGGDQPLPGGIDVWTILKKGKLRLKGSRM